VGELNECWIELDPQPIPAERLSRYASRTGAEERI
jgi:hypothetical protein